MKLRLVQPNFPTLQVIIFVQGGEQGIELQKGDEEGSCYTLSRDSVERAEISNSNAREKGNIPERNHRDSLTSSFANDIRSQTFKDDFKSRYPVKAPRSTQNDGACLSFLTSTHRNCFEERQSTAKGNLTENDTTITSDHSRPSKQRKLGQNAVLGRDNVDARLPVSPSLNGQRKLGLEFDPCCNHFAEEYLPLAPQLPNFQESKEYVRNLIDPRESIERRAYIDEVIGMAEGRAFFQTRDGYIGFGPNPIKPGDQACVIFGCQSLLILRPNDANNYRVVGECYVDGFMDGEALLGALPSNWQRVYRHFPDLGQSYDGLMNTQTGYFQIEDPRLGPLPTGWRIADHREKHAYNKFSNEQIGVLDTSYDPRLSPEALKARGVNLQEIRLV